VCIVARSCGPLDVFQHAGPLVVFQHAAGVDGVHDPSSPTCSYAFGAQTELMRVDVETVSEVTAGQTVCDVWHQSKQPKNVVVAKVSGALPF